MTMKLEHARGSPDGDVQHVVVPLDGSNLAAAALPTARAVAARFGATLSTISVADNEADAEKLRTYAEGELGSDLAAGRDEALVVVSKNPSAEITKELRDRPGAFLVMSTRGNGRVTGAVLGSVAGDILASIDAPFLAVGPQADRPGWLVGRPRRRPSQFPVPLSVGAVVALVDGTGSDEEALPAATAWAAALDRELVVLSVAEDAPAGFDGTAPNRFGPRDPQGYVNATADNLRATVPQVRGEVVLDPLGVASGVRSYLRDRKVALIVLAATRRTGLERLRLGATAADIVRASTAPALIVPVKQQSPTGTKPRSPARGELEPA